MDTDESTGSRAGLTAPFNEHGGRFVFPFLSVFIGGFSRFQRHRSGLDNWFFAGWSGNAGRLAHDATTPAPDAPPRWCDTP